ncbi:uncharacterized protein N7479_001362 [Penicillium vulpinum]|uniref:BZIP domain-containing protein n=1 Tax=Penicillium vulpinum TaxID=29845 RepID=A0A1V6RUR6_9EURO|nr:uncharacterized protein N7479_001362 [Penicillium vulpinum]KAJ5971444.1 hypothetical protein N7479_001362 [Penicillium vulpinum]OQE05270.1 hypothetical protein PENVUL_c026G08444 [Penicillium vulpinum]
MEVNVQFMSDTAERRRTQNRLAQRKFREKKRKADDAILETAQDPKGAFGAPSQSTSTANNNGDFPMNFLPLFANELPTVAGASSPTEIPITSTELWAGDNFDLDAIDESWYQFNHDFSFPFPDPSHVQSSITQPYFIQNKSPGSASISTPSHSTTSDHLRSLSPPGNNHTLSLHRRTSDSDIRPESPGPQLPQSHNDDTVLGLITSARDNKGWISTLHIAAQKGHERIVRVLLLRGNMDVNKQDSDGRTPLIHAIIENHDSVVRLLLSHGARIGVYDCDGRSALHWAVLHRRLGILQQLLDHRDKYERSLDLDVYDNTGWTPLHMSVDRAFEAGILMLLQGGADINAKAKKCPHTGKVVPLTDR